MAKFVEIAMTVEQVDNVRAQFVAAEGEAAWMCFVRDGKLIVPSDLAAAVQALDPDAVSKGRLAAYAADKRWQVETGGIEVGGAAIDTGRESQAMITGAYAYAQANPSETISYKATSGWVTIDAATMAAIATAVGAHVQACFAAEASVAAEIEAGNITTTAEIDAADWPA